MNKRQPPMVADSDRFAVAALQADRLLGWMERNQRRRGAPWHHYANSAAGIYSVKS